MTGKTCLNLAVACRRPATFWLSGCRLRAAPSSRLAFCRTVPHNAPRADLGTKRMFDTAAARRMMVDCQVRTADVTDLDLIDGHAGGAARALRAVGACRRRPMSTATFRSATAARCSSRWCSPSSSRPAQVGSAAITSSMWAAAPAIRRRCWRGWPARWWRSKRTRRWRARAQEALAATATGNVTVVTGPLRRAGRRRRPTT